MEQRGRESAKAAAQRQLPEKAEPVLWKARRQQYNNGSADQRADPSEPSLSQGRHELRLADDGRGRPCPMAARHARRHGAREAPAGRSRRIPLPLQPAQDCWCVDRIAACVIEQLVVHKPLTLRELIVTSIKTCRLRGS